jgi:hypothetical protein
MYAGKGNTKRNHKRGKSITDQTKSRLWAAQIRTRLAAGEELTAIDFADYGFYGNIALTQLVLAELRDVIECPAQTPF